MESIGDILRRLIAEGKITDPDSTKGKLLAVAARLFRQKGYSRTTVREIAAEVGILSGSIFHHYRNKDEILYRLMMEVVIAMEEMLRLSLGEARTSAAKVRALIKNEVMFIHGKTGDATAVLLYEWGALSDDRKREVTVYRDAYNRMWDEVLTQAQEDGLTVIEPNCLRHLLHGATVWTVNWFDKSGPLTLDDLVENIYRLAIK